MNDENNEPHLVSGSDAKAFHIKIVMKVIHMFASFFYFRFVSFRCRCFPIELPAGRVVGMKFIAYF